MNASRRSISEFLNERSWLCLLLPPLLALLVHLPALRSDLFWDDGILILAHPRIADPSFLREIPWRDYGLEFSGEPVGYYRPFFMFINFGLYQLFGPNAFAYHLVVLLIFSFACFVVTMLTQQALGERQNLLALTVGCLAAIHPVRTEFAVFFMSMPDVLIEIFIALIIAISLGAPRRWPDAIRAISAGVLSLACGLTKESGLLVAGAVGATLLGFSIPERTRRAGVAIGLAVVAGVAAAYLLRIMAGVETPRTISTGALQSWSTGRGLGAVAQAFAELIVPSPTVFTGSAGRPPTAMIICGACLLVGLVIVYVWRLFARQSLFEALVSAWLLAGTFSLIMVRGIGLPFSDRYIPSAAAIIVVVVFATGIWRALGVRIHAWGRIPHILAFGYLALFAVFAFVSTVRCQTALGFFRIMAEDDPDNYYPRVVLTTIMLYQFQDISYADPYFREAVAIAPNAPRVRALGISRAMRLAELKRFREGLETLDWSAQTIKGDPVLWSLRATCQMGVGDPRGAMDSIQRAIRLAPHDASYRAQYEEIARAVR